MDFKFSKGTGDVEKQEAPGEKKNQSALLVLLLLLVGGFSYVYFFTGLIKPQEAPKPAEAPVRQVVKMPLPVSGGTVAATEQKVVVAKSEPMAAKEEPPKAMPPKPVPTAPVAAAPAAKPLPPAKPKEESKKPDPVKPADKKALQEPVADKKEQKSVATKVEEKKPAAVKSQTPAAKKPEPVKSADKKHAVEVASKSKKTAAVSGDTAKDGSGKSDAVSSWSVLVGQYAIEEPLSADMGRVRKAGLDPVVKAGPRKKSAMNRLLLAEFANRADAQTELSKLKRFTSDAFIIDQSGKHAVYAGSYLLDARASSEKERLNAAGFSVSVKRAEVAIPTQNLTVGPFSEKKAAEAALGKLKANGVKASLIPQ